MNRVCEYTSALAAPICDYIAEKRALGRKYDKESKQFEEFDRFLVRQDVSRSELSRDVVEKWVSKRPNEKRKNQRYRLNFTKRFALYLQHKGYSAYYPAYEISLRDDAEFVPYIFTNEELGNLLHYFDGISPSRSYPKRHVVLPLLFRTLICCGLRVSEAVNLRFRDVDLDTGVLLITEAKRDKKRFVPLSEDMWERYRTYSHDILQNSAAGDYFFPNARANSYHPTTIYGVFREALWHCGIAHQGRGYGPRVHDFRHTFAVRSMQKLEKTKGDIVMSLPYLSAYLGHCDISGSQVYLRLIAEHYPAFVDKLCAYLDDTIPTWEMGYEN